MSADKRFANQSVVITGATGGIGQATVLGFAREGATILATDLDSTMLGQLRAQVTDPSKCMIMAGDITDSVHIQRLIESVVDTTGKIDVLVNNAGLMRRGDILATSDDDWAASLAVNVTAVFRLCRQAIAQMRESGGGAIVNVASTWGIHPGPSHLAYCTSKAAVAAMTQCLGRDHASDGIRVNAVCPDEVNTPMLRSGFAIRGLDPDTAIKELNASVPIGHIAEPEEIADVIRFLASADARYMAGSLVEINGAKAVY